MRCSKGDGGRTLYEFTKKLELYTPKRQSILNVNFYLNKAVSERSIQRKHGWAWWLKPVIQLFGRQRLGGTQLGASPGKKFMRLHLNQ
jgi:hypothetical protein